MAAAISNVLDIVKTRVQISGAEDIRAGDVIRDIYKREGIMGFTRGLIPRYVLCSVY